MNEGTLSTAFSPNFGTKLCFFLLGENLPHGPLPVQTFLDFFWANDRELLGRYPREYQEKRRNGRNELLDRLVDRFG